MASIVVALGIRGSKGKALSWATLVSISRTASDTVNPMAARTAAASYPARWSGKTRNWQPIGAVTLNPERDSVIVEQATAIHSQQLAA